MKIIVGLGNPGKEYEHTRHNVGFLVINKISDDYNIKVNKFQMSFVAQLGKGNIKNEKVLLLKPQTYMNRSGFSVKKTLDYYKLTNKDLIVIYDDINFEVGDIKIKTSGSAGGHNGIKDIILNLNTTEFTRIKIGIGSKPKNYTLSDYVLSKFKPTELIALDDSIITASEACGFIVSEGVEKAMNKFNTKIDNN